MTRTLKPFAFAIPALLCAASAQAEININGFASVGGGFYDGNKSGSYQGYDADTFSGDPVNKIGLQFSAPVNEIISATGQLLAKGSNDYNIEAEWAYLTYAASDDFDVRVGRLRSPFFAYSDFLDVGYAYPWITPPDTVYRFVFTTVEGVDVLYRGSAGSWDYTAQAYYGRLTDETVLDEEDVDLDLQDFSGVNITFTRDWLTLRASYNRAEFSIETPSEVAAVLNGTSGTALDAVAGFPDVVQSITVEEETGQFWGLAAQIDYNDWLMNVEYTELLVDDQSLVSDDMAYYVMLGHRFDAITLHATYSAAESDIDEGFVASIPVPTLRAAVIDNLIPETDDEVITLGVRYDFEAATAFKVEVSDIQDNANDSDGTLVAFAIDTVF